MTSRRALCAAAVAAAALGLTACNPSGSGRIVAPPAPSALSSSPLTGGPGAGTAASSAPADSAPASAPAPAATGGSSQGAGGACGKPPALPAGVKMVDLSRPPTASALYAKDAVAQCNDVDLTWGWEATGAEKTYRISATATFELNTKGVSAPQTVTRAQFLSHAQKCESGAQDTFSMCMRPPGEATYKATVNASGEITDLSEVFYS